MNRNTALTRVLAFLAFVTLFQATARADDVDRRKLYLQSIKGVVAVMSSGGPATGWVVDTQKRWIVTCQHVVGIKDEVDVIFPVFKDGKLQQERSWYIKSATRMKAKVLSADSKRDLALIQVDALPPGSEALRLATDSAQSADTLHLIGNPSASGAMWHYSTGTVRAVYHKRFTYKNTTQEVDAVVGESQLPGNPGDSGAAVFNDRGEVVGVHSGGTPDGVQLMATYIDVVEIRKLLGEPFKGVAIAKSFDDFYAAGVDFYQGNQVEKALSALNEAIKLKPESSDAFRLRASCYIRKKQFDLAYADCNQAIELNKTNATAYNERAVCQTFKSDYKAALADYNEAIRLNPKDGMCWYGRAWTQNKLKEYKGAIQDATEAIKLDAKRDFALPYNERGLAYFYLKENKKALADFNQALELDANNAEFYYNRAVVEIELKRPDEALADLTRTIQLNVHDAQALKERGRLLFGRQQFQKAVEDYTAAMRGLPTDATLWLWRSWAYEQLKNREQADADFRKAKELDPTIGNTSGN
jgi:tetratricopeptide (TPR) repeat protein